jgi:hypothetical protein
MSSSWVGSPPAEANVRAAVADADAAQKADPLVHEHHL